MQTVKRRRLSADAWAMMVEKFSSSGLSEEQFCQQERVSLAGLRRWRATPRSTREPKPAAKVTTNEEAASFVDLGDPLDGGLYVFINRRGERVS